MMSPHAQTLRTTNVWLRQEPGTNDLRAELTYELRTTLHENVVVVNTVARRPGVFGKGVVFTVTYRLM